VQIDVHVLEYEVDILVVSRPDVGVPQLPEEHDLAVGALSIC
jgi:hypothetical protein